MLHLSGHDDVADSFGFQNVDQLAQLAERDPMAARRQPFDLRRRLFLDPDRDHFIAQPPRGFERQQRKAPVPGDHAVRAHYTNPRSDDAMNASSSSISGPISTSLLMRSTACVVFNPDVVSSRNALCRPSIFSGVNPRRSSLVLFGPKIFDSRGATVIE